MENAIFASGVGQDDEDAPRFSTVGRKSKNKIAPRPWAPRTCSFVVPPACDDDETDNLPCAPSSRMYLNICGEPYEVPTDVFAKHPTTLLGNAEKVAKYFDPVRQEFYFDRNRACFEAILAYYQSGTLHRPHNIPLKSFIVESRFFQLDKQALLQICSAEGFRPSKAVKLPKNKLQRALWLLVDDPHSSLAARIFSIVSLLVITLSVVILCMATMPQYLRAEVNMTQVMADAVNDSDAIVDAELIAGYEQFHDPLFIITTACIVWFTIEFLLRLISCPDKKSFFRSGINIVDLIAIVPYYIDIGVTIVGLKHGTSTQSKAGIMGVLRILRVIRIFRVVRLSRYSRGLQILGETFLISIRELGLLLLFLGIGVILFSCAIYYAELGVKDSQFDSIPEAFWWAIVTMTTVGYGDIAPKGLFGKLVGACCAISGLMAIALPVPVIVSNFNTLYLREKQRGEVEELLGDVLRPQNSEDERLLGIVIEQKKPPKAERQDTVMTILNDSFDEILRRKKPGCGRNKDTGP